MELLNQSLMPTSARTGCFLVHKNLINRGAGDIELMSDICCDSPFAVERQYTVPIDGASAAKPDTFQLYFLPAFIGTFLKYRTICVCITKIDLIDSSCYRAMVFACCHDSVHHHLSSGSLTRWWSGLARDYSESLILGSDNPGLSPQNKRRPNE